MKESRILLAAALGAILFSIPAQAEILEANGRITFLRVQDVGTGYGPPTDFLDGEVVVKLDTEPGKVFGLQLRNGPNYRSHRSELDLLRRAFEIGRPVTIDYEIAPGKTNAIIIRSWLSPAPPAVRLKYSAGEALQPQPRGPREASFPMSLDQEDWSKMGPPRYAGTYPIKPGEDNVFSLDLATPSLILVKVSLFGGEPEKVSAQLIQQGQAQPNWTASAIRLGESLGYISGQISITADHVAAGKQWSLRLLNTITKPANAEVTIHITDLALKPR